jgi:hypothetical protein
MINNMILSLKGFCIKKLLSNNDNLKGIIECGQNIRVINKMINEVKNNKIPQLIFDYIAFNENSKGYFKIKLKTVNIRCSSDSLNDNENYLLFLEKVLIQKDISELNALYELFKKCINDIPLCDQSIFESGINDLSFYSCFYGKTNANSLNVKDIFEESFLNCANYIMENS